ncbi:hypothetical protein SKAU_G00155010 [Synaphobranchus kaupii]|uniref:CCHC-type domain-containing protein n=1 Tax=Synaphobranchus kaupii TaxID=118154 RepID=A0A9Q1FHH1_SYNKA|nr:hypothetical protein SKAU_G00155010 [Synaphobranchus kaupii]
MERLAKRFTFHSRELRSSSTRTDRLPQRRLQRPRACRPGPERGLAPGDNERAHARTASPSAASSAPEPCRPGPERGLAPGDNERAHAYLGFSSARTNLSPFTKDFRGEEHAWTGPPPPAAASSAPEPAGQTDRLPQRRLQRPRACRPGPERGLAPGDNERAHAYLGFSSARTNLSPFTKDFRGEEHAWTDRLPQRRLQRPRACRPGPERGLAPGDNERAHAYLGFSSARTNLSPFTKDFRGEEHAWTDRLPQRRLQRPRACRPGPERGLAPGDNERAHAYLGFSSARTNLSPFTKDFRGEEHAWTDRLPQRRLQRPRACRPGPERGLAPGDNERAHAYLGFSSARTNLSPFTKDFRGEEHAWTDRLPQRRLQRPRACRPGPERGLAPGDNERAHAYLGFSSARTNLSPFTKDFRGEEHAWTDRLPQRRLQRPRACRPGPERGLAPGDNERAHAYLGFSSARTNLSPFTKDFRGEEHAWTDRLPQRRLQRPRACRPGPERGLAPGDNERAHARTASPSAASSAPEPAGQVPRGGWHLATTRGHMRTWVSLQHEQIFRLLLKISVERNTPGRTASPSAASSAPEPAGQVPRGGWHLATTRGHMRTWVSLQHEQIFRLLLKISVERNTPGRTASPSAASSAPEPAGQVPRGGWHLATTRGHMRTWVSLQHEQIFRLLLKISVERNTPGRTASPSAASSAPEPAGQVPRGGWHLATTRGHMRTWVSLQHEQIFRLLLKISVERNTPGRTASPSAASSAPEPAGQTDRLPQRRLQRPRACRPGPERGLAPGDNERAHAYLGFSSARTNLSPFTKDFRGEEHAWTDRLPQRRLQRPRACRPGPERGLAPGDNERAHAYLGFSSARTNLSPFTKDFRGEEHAWPGVRGKNAFGVWNGKRQFLVRLMRDAGGIGGVRHLPAVFSIGPDKGYLTYAGLPTYCRRCLRYGHMAKDCTDPFVCSLCGEQGHVARECSQKKSCHLCGSTEHLVRNCPKRNRSFAEAVQRGRQPPGGAGGAAQQASGSGGAAPDPDPVQVLPRAEEQATLKDGGQGKVADWAAEDPSVEVGPVEQEKEAQGAALAVLEAAVGELVKEPAGKEKEKEAVAEGSGGTASEGVSSLVVRGDGKEAAKHKRSIGVDWPSLEEADHQLGWGGAAEEVLPSKKVKTVEPQSDSDVAMSVGSEEGLVEGSSSPLSEVGYENVGLFSTGQNDVAYLSEEGMGVGFVESGD